MEEKTVNIVVKRKMSKGTKIAFIIMAVLLTLSMTTTIVLAAFSASKTSTATLTFANGLQLKLDPKTSDAAIKITSAPAAVTGTFSYTGTMTGLNSNVSLDGIKATLVNQAGYIAYSIQLKEGDAAIAGSWSALSSQVSTFTPTGSNTDWVATLTVPSGWALVSTPSNSTIKVKNTSSIAVNTATEIFSGIVFKGKTTAANVTSLGGRSIILAFTIKADTGAVPSV